VWAPAYRQAGIRIAVVAEDALFVCSHLSHQKASAIVDELFRGTGGKLMTHFLLQSHWPKALAVFTGMVLLGIVCAVLLQSPLTPLPFSPRPSPGPTAEELMVRAEAEGKMKAARSILTITEERFVKVKEATGRGNTFVAPTFEDDLDRIRGQYLQARTEFQQKQWSLSLTHILPVITDLTASYETLAPFPPQ